jgi:hypothetical protein
MVDGSSVPGAASFATPVPNSEKYLFKLFFTMAFITSFNVGEFGNKCRASSTHWVTPQYFLPTKNITEKALLQWRMVVLLKQLNCTGCYHNVSVT